MNHKHFLGVDLPIIQAPMAGVQNSALTLAVSGAGGLGSLPCAMLAVKDIAAELTAITAQTNKPFNLNFFCHTPPRVSAERETRWRQELAPYFREFRIEPESIPAAAMREPFNEEIAAVIAPFKPSIVSFHFGLPPPHLLQLVKSWGAKVLSSATTVEEAQWLETNGADGIIAQGLEAGGHRGMFLTQDISTQSGTFALLPQIVGSVKLPVIAAGGISNALGVKTALALGATAVQIGTAYLLCNETEATDIHRQALTSAKAAHTAVTNIFSGRPARSIVNRGITELGPINEFVPDFPLAAAAITAVRKVAESKGSGDFSPLWCGQNATGCKAISAAALTTELAAQS